MTLLFAAGQNTGGQDIDGPWVSRNRRILIGLFFAVLVVDVAARLHLSPGTVRNHLSAAIQKLGARNRAEAVQIAQRKGWL